MKRKTKKVTFIAAALSLMLCVAAQAANEWAVDDDGNITLNGEIFRIKGGSWFGLEGRHEPPDDPDNPAGAPMEMFIGNVFWNESGRTLQQDAEEIAALGFNSIRLPLVPQTLDDNDPQGRDPYLKNAESVRIQGAFTALKEVIKACANAGLYVLLDMHACSNYIGWRGGRLDARPPYADANREHYEFTREDCSCAATDNPSSVTRIQAYDKEMWLEDLKILAGLGEELGVDNILGIDIFNEPWDYSWEEWRSMIDASYEAISSVNPNILIFAQGIGGSNGHQDGTPETTEDTPHGDPSTNPNWGENLYEAGINPPSMPKSKLVYSPHCYGPSVCTQPMFADLEAQPECAGLIEDAFGDAECQIVIDQDRLEVGWEEHFGYLKDLGYAICIGEFGGNMDWPNKSEQRHVERYSYLNDNTTDRQWQEAFVEYLKKKGIYDSYYWSINPESSDTYGIFKSTFDPISNKEGWGTWTTIDQRKMTLLEDLWAEAENYDPDAPDYHPELPVNPSERTMSPKGVNCTVSSNGAITYSLPEAANVSLQLYNVNGRLQSEINGLNQSAGTHSISREKLAVPAQTYLLVFKAGERVHKQMVHLTK
ncbi:MAG: glycoside hydrolase family 5 protein [Chitinivibrionales bacterium]